jgi:hypothetical protein
MLIRNSAHVLQSPLQGVGKEESGRVPTLFCGFFICVLVCLTCRGLPQDKCCAFVDFRRQEDCVAAFKGMQGVRVGDYVVELG